MESYAYTVRTTGWYRPLSLVYKSARAFAL